MGTRKKVLGRGCGGALALPSEVAEFTFDHPGANCSVTDTQLGGGNGDFDTNNDVPIPLLDDAAQIVMLEIKCCTHGQGARLGSARGARPLRLLRARLAALADSALEGGGEHATRHPQPPRVLELTACKVIGPTTCWPPRCCVCVSRATYRFDEAGLHRRSACEPGRTRPSVPGLSCSPDDLRRHLVAVPGLRPPIRTRPMTAGPLRPYHP